jgi:hypothetical protein
MKNLKVLVLVTTCLFSPFLYNSLGIMNHSAVNNLGKQYFSTSSSPNDPQIVPEKFYENADSQKLDILVENKGKSGIYM